MCVVKEKQFYDVIFVWSVKYTKWWEEIGNMLKMIYLGLKFPICIGFASNILCERNDNWPHIVGQPSDLKVRPIVGEQICLPKGLNILRVLF